MPKQRKNKKIHKNKTNSPHPKQTQNKPQSGNDLKQQQFSHQQGMFQQLANIDENDGNSQRAQNVNQQEINKNNTKIQGYSISNGFLYTLDIGLCYRIINVGQSKEKIKDICVVDGMVDVNGKLYRERFGIKDNNSLIILAKKGQQAKDNSKRIVEQHTKIPKKVKNQRKLNKNIRQVVQKLKTSAILSQQQSVISEQLQFYLHNYQSHENILLFSNHNLTIYKLNTKNKPWQNINPHEYINKGQTTLVIGLKNTGKSMLCDYLLNWADRQDKQLCILDLDIGRNRVYPGTVSLEILDNSQPNKNEVLSIWVGEYTPVNSIPVYIKAINQLYNYYKQKHFTKSLIVNTMGYLTGVGQLIIYQIFNVLKPQKMLIIQNNSGQQDWATQNIRKNIQSGNYTERLYFKVNEQSAKSSTRILKYKNQFAQQKAASDRFQSLLSVNAISSLDSLLIQIYSRRLRKLNKNIQIYRNSKQGNINQVQYFTKTHTEMRIIVLGQFWRNGLVNVRGIGFGWDGGIYYNQHILQEQQIEIGIISDGLDFDRSFYSINQAKMIQIQNMLGIRLPYICSIFKVLGNKGMRNNSSKKSNSKQAQFN